MRFLLAALMFFATPAQAGEVGQYLYVLHCSGCHVRDGSGSADGRIPRLAGVVGHFEKLPEGRKFILQVPGVMNSGLKDDDVAALMNWLVRNLAGDSLAGPFTPYTPAEVANARTGRPKDIFAARRAITTKLKAQGYEIKDY